ncbi:EamA family transporter [Anaerolinea sp.]|uniref:EamA family transporter n=1 Tax=Anaerolinea sp. TaxID=1872519 RepID=UPI002ACD5B1B|nr:EamA family transporter [Anaerolinea sp.]
MLELVLVSLIWAFSFGLIKVSLAGVDSNFVAFVRLFVSFLVFLPFARPSKIPRNLVPHLILVGALQYGAMYLAYLNAFKFLKAYEVALFTIFTPIYVTLIHDFLEKRWERLHWLAAVLAIIGTAIVQGLRALESDFLLGFLIVQASNLCFAFGQVYYRKILQPHPELRDHQIFFYPYLGGFALAGLATLLFTHLSAIQPTGAQWLTLLYLGAVASGLGFFLWNRGARKVNAGTLAVFNDLKIPLAVTVSLVVFGEKASLPNLIVGGLIVLTALMINEYKNIPFLRRQEAVE